MKSFSQRKGYKPVSEQIQAEGMNEELRNSLWNVLREVVFSDDQFKSSWEYEAPIVSLAKTIWIGFFKQPVDTIPAQNPTNILVALKNYFFSCKWFEAYDFIEFVINKCVKDEHRAVLIMYTNQVLAHELAGYRLVEGFLVDITSEQELEMLEEAIQDSQFEGVSLHLKRALELLSDRKNPDYRNSVKESISAVESMAKIVAENPKATLGDALKALEKNKELHPALKGGFSSLYGYTSDAGGVRHAMLAEPDITAADAKFFLLSCTSFVNYLKSKI